MNHPAVCVAILAAAIAFGSLIVAIIGLVIAAKSYKKSKRLEFFQRRDQLFAKISDLNAKNSEVHLISARYEIVAIMKASLGLRGEQAEENAAVVARIKELRRKMEEQANNWEEKIQQLHSICSSLTPQTDAARVENLIAMVQIISDDTKKYNDINLSSLHILENTNSIIETSLVESEEKRRQIDLDLIKAIKELTKTTEYGPANE
jgi:metal-responsive CopG/Arc/MetJ family transcriptional regulator